MEKPAKTSPIHPKNLISCLKSSHPGLSKYLKLPFIFKYLKLFTFGTLVALYQGVAGIVTKTAKNLLFERSPK